MITSQQICRWHSFDQSNLFQQATVTAILQAAHQAIAARGAFHLVLAGGSTPQKIYAALRAVSADWPHWHIYFGDERCLPVHHPERNSQMAAQAWLNHTSIPARQIHPLAAELGALAAAEQYNQLVDYIELFDLVLLGLGEDGHTASLFPAHDWGCSTTAAATLAVFDAPKPPAERVSLSARRLSLARQVIFLVSGGNKQAAVTRWQNTRDIPAAAITPQCGVDVHLCLTD